MKSLGIGRLLVLLILVGLGCFSRVEAANNGTGGASFPLGYPADIAAIKKQGTLTVALYDNSMPPFFMRDATGHWSGLDIDFANQVAGQLGVTLTLKPANTFDDVINMVATGQANMGLGLINITPSRALHVSFSVPYYQFHPSLLVNRMMLGQFGWNSSDVVAHLLAGDRSLKIGAIQSSSNIDLLKHALPEQQIVTFPTGSDAMQAVSEGQIFAAIADNPEQISNWLQAHPKAVLQTNRVVITSRVVRFAVALSPQAPNLKAWLDIYIYSLVMDGEMDVLFSRYGVTDRVPL